MIGIFDSGAGGLSVWKELLAVAPGERYFYISDNANCPYGPKSKEFVLGRATAISDYLISQGAEIIVVACNTATAAAIDSLRSRYDIPFVGMEPAVKPAAIETKSGVIGVLATRGTFNGRLYINTSEKFARSRDVKIIETVGDGLVELVEEGRTDTPEAEALVRKYIEPMVEAGADHIVLGCTHYPFLSGLIEKIAGESVKILNPAPAVAAHAIKVLQDKRAKTEKSNRNVTISDSADIIATTGTNIGVLESIAESVTAGLRGSGLLKSVGVESNRRKKYLTLSI